MSAGDGEIDDVLVGGGKQGDKEETEDKQEPPEAGIGPAPHFGIKFTLLAWARQSLVRQAMARILPWSQSGTSSPTRS